MSTTMSPVERAGFAAVIRGRHNPDFSTPFALGDDDRAIMTMRGLTTADQDAAAAIWSGARDAVASGSALSYLKGLDASSLQVLQHAACLADPISTGNLSEEGAENLLVAPTEGIDRNHDGLLEVGIGRMITFPPPDASPQLRSAWNATVDGMNSQDALMLVANLAFPAMSVDGTTTRAADFSSENFDWSSWMASVIEGAKISAPWNTDEANRATMARLERFLDALKDNGLA